MKDTARNAIPINGIIKIQAFPDMIYTSRRAYFSQVIGMIRHQSHVILSASEESGVWVTRFFAGTQND